MIRGKRNDAYSRQMLRVDCGGWESYREAVSYIDRYELLFADFECFHPTYLHYHQFCVILNSAFNSTLLAT